MSHITERNVSVTAFVKRKVLGSGELKPALLQAGTAAAWSANTAHIPHPHTQPYADIILPVCSGFEMEAVYMRRDDRAIRWQKQVVARVGESKPDWEIWIELAHTISRLDTKNPPEYWTENLRAEWKDYRKLWDVF